MPSSLYNDIMIELDMHDTMLREERKREEEMRLNEARRNGYTPRQYMTGQGNSNLGSLTERIERVSNSYKPTNDAGK